MSQKLSTSTDVSRRQFILKSAATGAGLTGLIVASSSIAQAPSSALDTEQTTTHNKPRIDQGYHETDHIRDYYRTAAQ